MNDFRIIYAEKIDKYLAQMKVEYFGWGGPTRSEGMDMEKWLKVGDWVETAEEAKFNISCHTEFDRSQATPTVVYEVTQ